MKEMNLGERDECGLKRWMWWVYTKKRVRDNN